MNTKICKRRKHKVTRTDIMLVCTMRLITPLHHYVEKIAEEQPNYNHLFVFLNRQHCVFSIVLPLTRREILHNNITYKL